MIPFMSISVLVLIIIYARTQEKKKWNNGHCSQCGSKWKMFSKDSQGGRMYKCGNGHYCNCSYNIDKIKD